MGFRAALPDDVATSKLLRDLSPKRVYMQNVAHHRTEVPPLFRGGKQLPSLRPAQTPPPDSEGAQASKPYLLQQVEELLDKKLQACEKRAAAYGPLRESWAAATLRLDAHRQVFEALVNSMTTYRPVLTRIRQAYDAALDEALKVSYEAVHMQAELSSAEAKQAAAVDAALTESAELAMKLRRVLLGQVAAAEERAAAQEAEAAAAGAAAKDAAQQLTLLKRKAAELRADNQRLLQGLQQRSSWSPEALAQGAGGAAAAQAATWSKLAV